MEGGEGGEDFFIILEVCRERGGWREERVGMTSSSSLRCVEREGWREERGWGEREMGGKETAGREGDG